MQRAKASAALSCADPPAEFEVLVVSVVAEAVVVSTAATPGLDEPPHADTSMDRPSSPASADVRSSGRERRRVREADSLRELRLRAGSVRRFTLSMIARPR
jgi:hypothetical protein